MRTASRLPPLAVAGRVLSGVRHIRTGSNSCDFPPAPAGNTAPFIQCDNEPEDNWLDASSEPFFSLATIATHDLLPLNVSKTDPEFLKDFGYALHNLPTFVMNPGVFQRDYFWFDMYFFARHHSRLTPEFKAAFARVVGRTVAEVERALRERTPLTGNPLTGSAG